jgi:predicted NBD/HSP70 family sugar kinase/predicted transcriptional regulator
MEYINISQTLNPSQQHIINQSAIFHYLRENGPTYRANIARNLDLSLPAVGRALDALLNRGFVEIKEHKRNDRTRAVPYFQATLMEHVIVSIDLFKGIIAAFNMEKMATPYYFKLSLKEPLINELSVVIEYYFSHILKKNIQMMKSLCICSPGIVDIKKGQVIKATYHPYLENIPIRDQLLDRYQCVVFITNAENAAAFNSYWEFEKKHRNIVSFGIGLEAGAGLIIGGLVYYGENYMAGETEFFIDDIEHPENKYKTSCSFRKLCADVVFSNEGKHLDILEIEEEFCLRTISTLFISAYKNESAACKAIDSFVCRIALLLNKIDSLLNPSIIVIGGDICQMPYSEEVFLTRLKERYNPLRISNVEICYSRHGPLVNLQGGGLMALENYLCEQFPYIIR